MTADAYSLVERCALDGTPLPLVEAVFQIATACALSFGMFTPDSGADRLEGRAGTRNG